MSQHYRSSLPLFDDADEDMAVPSVPEQPPLFPDIEPKPLPPLEPGDAPDPEPDEDAAEEAVRPAADETLYGLDLFGQSMAPRKGGPLAERFEFPPFSVLSARDGEWQERKRAWLAQGIKSEVGRGGAGQLDESGRYLGENAPGGSRVPCDYYTGRRPVLCELAYRWFCPPGGQIVDPFAGGSVRGIVAGLLGYRYHGIDLNAEQLAANEEQRAAIAPDATIAWACGDSMNLLEHAPDADFIFSCPPYGDLERYSEDPRDLSTMEYHAFLAAYRRVILRCASKLRQDRLACFVVGDFRDRRTGMLRGFVADTINAFREIGMPLFNEAILVTMVGSLPIRVSSQFEASRKLGKSHQNCLVFAKGDPRRAFDGRA